MVIRTLATAVVVSAFAVAAAAQSASQQGASRQVTLMGCVRQTSDQPTVYALEEIQHNSASGTVNGYAAPSTAANTTEGTPSAASYPDKSASRNTSSASRNGGSSSNNMRSSSSNTGSSMGSAWYRLSSGAAGDLQQYANKPVRIVGSVTPGRDEKGADMMIYRVRPGMVVVSAVDLKPAPQISIQSISAAQGTCPQGTSK